MRLTESKYKNYEELPLFLNDIKFSPFRYAFAVSLV